MDASVGKTVLVYLMLLCLASPALSYSGNVTGVSLVGGSGPHEGTVQLVVASDDGSQPPLVTGSMAHLHHYITSTAICRTLGYPEVNRVFEGFSPYLADVIEEPSFHINCWDDTTVIGCPAHTYHHAQRGAVKCQTDTGYMGCFRDKQAARPLANSTCPPSPNSNYSCIDRDNMTTESCLEYCKTLNESDVIITYAGVRAGIECTCGVNTRELKHVSDGISCNWPCSGDRTYSNCGGLDHIAAFNITPSSVTSEPDGQEATTHALHSSPDPADTTPADTTQEPDGDSSFSTSVGNSVQNAGVGARVGAVIFIIMAGVNVYGYE